MRCSLIRSLTSLLCVPLVLGSIAAVNRRRDRRNQQTSFLGASWSRISPLENAGWSKEKLNAARRYDDADSIHTSAVMIVQAGEVVEQWGDIDQKIDSYSVRKTPLSALYGIYVSEGAIDVNQTLEQLEIEDSPDLLTRQEKQARIVDLLRARSGVWLILKPNL